MSNTTDKCSRRMTKDDIKIGTFIRFTHGTDQLFQIVDVSADKANCDLLYVQMPKALEKEQSKINKAYSTLTLLLENYPSMLVNPGPVQMPLKEFASILPGDILTTTTVDWGYYVRDVKPETKSLSVVVVDPKTGKPTGALMSEINDFRWGHNFFPEKYPWTVTKNSGLHPDQSDVRPNKTAVFSTDDAEKPTDFYSSSKVFSSPRTEPKRPDIIDFGGIEFTLVDDMQYLAFEFLTEDNDIMTLLVDEPIYAAVVGNYLLIVDSTGKFHSVTQSYAHSFWEMKDENFLSDAVHKQRIINLLNSVTKSLRPVSTNSPG